MIDPHALVDRAWEVGETDPATARELGRRVVDAGGDTVGWGWILIALAETRIGGADVAADALAQARIALAAAPQPGASLVCDEVRALMLLRAGDADAAAEAQRAIDAAAAAAAADAVASGAAGGRGDAVPPIRRYLSHAGRAETARRLGRHDEMLRHGHAAVAAALDTGWTGPRITALLALGDDHWHLHQIEDARCGYEQALQVALDVGATGAVAASAARLVLVGVAARRADAARDHAETVRRALDVVPARPALAAAVALGHLAVGEFAAAEAMLAAVAGDGIGIGSGDGDASDADATGSAPAPAPAPASWLDEAAPLLRGWVATRCRIARGDPIGALAVADAALGDLSRRAAARPSIALVELCRAAADAAEAAGDTASALRRMRRALALHEALAARGAALRSLWLNAGDRLVQAQRERDLALDSRRSAEDDRHRLAELNAALREQIAQTERLHVQLREQALRDPLTGLHNRRYLFEVAPAMIELARRQSTQLCVVLIDLDHFKLLNDTHGHQAGDLVLQRFAALLTQMLRRSDVVCRHGGEEFVAVMPDITGDGAEAMLGRLLEAFQAQRAELGTRRLPAGSFSAGIARAPRHGHTLEQLLSRADRALYAAKNQGRARIEQAPKTGFGSLL